MDIESERTRRPVRAVSSARARRKPGWTAANSADLYQVDQWGAGFFTVNARGRLEVRPHRTAPGCDLFELVQSLKRRGLTAPILFRFDQIVESRVRDIQHGFAALV